MFTNTALKVFGPIWILALLVIVGCSDVSGPEYNPDEGEEVLKMSMDLGPLSEAGIAVDRVHVQISMREFTKEMDLTITGTMASGLFEGLEPGQYDILVHLFDGETEVATGSGQAEVIAGQTVTATIQIQLNTGNLEIVIEWDLGDGEDLNFTTDFSSSEYWINETGGAYGISEGKLSFTIDRSSVQRMYIPLADISSDGLYTGDLTIQYDFQLTSRENNVWLELGLVSDLLGGHTFNGPRGFMIQFGWIGGGTPYDVYYVLPLARYSDQTYKGGAWNYEDPSSYLAYQEDRWYRAKLEKSGLNWRLSLIDIQADELVGEMQGVYPAEIQDLKYLYLGNPDDQDWPTGTGFLDNLEIRGASDWTVDM